MMSACAVLWLRSVKKLALARLKRCSCPLHGGPHLQAKRDAAKPSPTDSLYSVSLICNQLGEHGFMAPPLQMVAHESTGHAQTTQEQSSVRRSAHRQMPGAPDHPLHRHRWSR